MIPFRDNVPSRTIPVVTIAIIAVNVAAFLYQLSLPANQLEALIYFNGVVPAKLRLLGQTPTWVLADATRTIFWSMFLHGGWLHLLGNMWYLWIFGDNVEDRMGHLRFLFFYLLCGFAGGAVHIAFNLQSEIPSIGASGAVAGVLGAYLLSYPFARVLTLIPLFFIWPVVELPALIVLGSWFFVQLLNGAAAIAVSTQTVGGIAWWAHVGGFVAGLVLIGLFARPEVRRYRWEV